jgi:hypothetical protein
VDLQLFKVDLGKVLGALAIKSLKKRAPLRQMATEAGRRIAQTRQRTKAENAL